MTDKEKLIELLLLADPNPYECEEQSGSCELTTCTQCRAENTANILLSNGVVVRDKGEWVAQTPEDDKYCWSPFKCNKCNMPGGKNRTNFCPNCGADLRRKNDI